MAAGDTAGRTLADTLSRPELPEAIRAGRIIAIGRNLGPAGAVEIGAALVGGGVRAFEVTLQGDVALAAIEALVARFGRDGDERSLAVGAGTVLTPADAEAAVRAGATFLVMPHLDEAIVRWAAGHGVPSLPGTFTPTEILAAWRAGAAAVKLFPASAVGPTFVRELRGPLPEIPLVPTGGVTIESAPTFLDAGATAVGIGGWLTGDRDPAGIRERAARLVAAVGAGR